MKTEDKIILALDGMTYDEALETVREVGRRVWAVKVHDLYDATGPSLIVSLKRAGATRVWVDAKLADIPTTVKLRAGVYRRAGADIVSVHATAGLDSVRAVRNSYAPTGTPELTVYGITVLTSIEDASSVHLFGSNCAGAALRYGLLVEDDVDGIVCSAAELRTLGRVKCDKIVPGTRSIGKNTHDQKRTGTPAYALEAGASKLVIGRQVTCAGDRGVALDDLAEEIAGVQYQPPAAEAGLEATP